MDEFLRTCLIVCPLIFLANFVDSVAGGGGLISIPAYLLAGVPTHLALGTNKVVNGVGMSFASLNYIRSGKVCFRIAIWAVLTGLVGGSLGASLALRMDGDTLQTILLFLLPAIAVFLVLKKDFGKERAEPLVLSRRREIVLSCAIGLFCGIYDGMFGPGTGTFMLMAFSMLLGLDLLTAGGCARVINTATCLASAVTFLLQGSVYWRLVAPTVAFSVAGNIAGSRYALRGGSQRVRSMIFVVLGMLFVKVALELF